MIKSNRIIFLIFLLCLIPFHSIFASETDYFIDNLAYMIEGDPDPRGYVWVLVKFDVTNKSSSDDITIKLIAIDAMGRDLNKYVLQRVFLKSSETKTFVDRKLMSVEAVERINRWVGIDYFLATGPQKQWTRVELDFPSKMRRLTEINLESLRILGENVNWRDKCTRLCVLQDERDYLMDGIRDVNFVATNTKLKLYLLQNCWYYYKVDQ